MAASNYITDKVQTALRNFLQAQSLPIPSDQIYKGIENAEAADDEQPPDSPTTRKLPCIECICQEANAEDEHFLNWLCDARVQIRTNADDTTETSHHVISAEVLNVLTTDTLAADLTAALDDFTVFLVNFKAQRWELIERSWQSVIEFQVHCAGSDIS